jgi:hypothetical protein
LSPALLLLLRILGLLCHLPRHYGTTLRATATKLDVTAGLRLAVAQSSYPESRTDFEIRS